jgi:hypothetical protein
MAELTRKELILILASVPHLVCRKPDHLLRLAGVDLSGLDLRGLNLAHADLAGADLRGCDLSDARLTEADLSGANLTDADLRGVYAEGATFVDAVLVRADFRKSDRDLFYGTHLAGADFQGADLTDARLDGVQLWGARFGEANLARANLRGARMNEQTVLAGARLLPGQLEDVEWAETRVDAPASPQADDARPAARAIAVSERLPLFPAPPQVQTQLHTLQPISIDRPQERSAAA